MELFDARSLSADAKEALRRRAVHAVVEQGRTRREMAHLLGVTPQAVGKWVQAYCAGGEAALAAQPQGRPKRSGTKLLPWQAAQVARRLKDQRPEQLKLPFYLWTCEAVAELIERRFGVRVSRWTAGRYLKRWGFTPQKPLRRAREQNPAAVARWLKEEYPQLKRDAKREGAQIVWGDEMGLRADRTAGRSYSPRGQTPVIPGTGQRFRCNLISALTNQGALSFMVFRESFTVAVFLRFLRRLIRQQKGRKIYLIVDGHPVHRAKLVQRIERRVPIFPFSREVGKLSTLQRGLALYRLAFGQPQQEDLLAYLDAAGIAGGAMEDGGARISLEPIDEDPPG